jgi:hypothetical protein
VIYMKHLMQFDGDGYSRLRRKISDINEMAGQFTVGHPNLTKISDSESGIKVSVPALDILFILYGNVKPCLSFLQCEILS